jgi:16S rRNA G1207 methylase RsmC
MFPHPPMSSKVSPPRQTLSPGVCAITCRFRCHAPVESFSLLYLNPPYDFEVSEGRNARMETVFLEHFYRWLKPGGVLVMVIPFDRVYACRRVLTPHFRDKGYLSA